MKKILLISFVLLNSCSQSINNLDFNNYKSHLNTSDYKPYKITLLNQRTDNSLYQIDELIPYNKNPDSKIIKSDFKFKTESLNDFKIDNVVLSDSGIQVNNNQGEIIPDYSNSKNIKITVNGDFPLSSFLENKFFFINEPDLLHLSYIGEKELKTVALIDNSIVLKPVSSSLKYVNFTVDSKSVPDFYLKGNHQLKIIAENRTLTTMIKIGDPVAPKESLTPYISKIELLKKENDNSKAMALKLIGKNFMINPQFYYAKVDGVHSPGYQTNVIKTTSGDIFETVINISKQNNFLNKQNHVIEFYTPFGMFYSEFKV